MTAWGADQEKSAGVAGQEKESIMLEAALLRILACPIDKLALLYFADEELLYNPRLRRVYRIEDGVPLMLAQQADPIADEEHARLMRRTQSGMAVRTLA